MRNDDQRRPHVSINDPVRVIIADDQAIVRSGLGAFVMAYEQLQLVGEARDGEEAIELCELLQPDVVLMDLKMPRMDGIASKPPHPPALAEYPGLGADQLQREGESARRSGEARNRLPAQNLSANDLAEAIMQVHQGRRLIAPEASEAIVMAERMARLEGRFVPPKTISPG